jgi:NADPH-dependent 2,4-dienoyl-CoA reductase/sulfur reductase-like enzyme/nitrite reductase/ring-hydroxylating ferredoxin subunit
MEERVASTEELLDGQMKQVAVGGKKVLLARVGGRYYAIGARCPHYGGPLPEGTLNEGRVTCPWHQGTLDVRTGDLLEPPPLDAVPSFAVRVEGSDVYVDRPDDAKSQRLMPMCACDIGRDPRTFAILGGGAAAQAAADALRQHCFEGRILVITQEERWPYDRPNLSKDYLSGEMKADWLPLRAPGFYERHGVERLVAHVTDLDVSTRTVSLEDGVSLSPDAVLIATGSSPRMLDVPGADLPGIFTLRSWTDCEAIIGALEGAENAVVVGSSFIGMEVAVSLLQRGLAVTVVSPDRVPFEQALGEPVGRSIMELHEKKGTRFRLGRRARTFIGDDQVSSVELDDGTTLPADLVVVGIGVVPNTGFVRGVAGDADGGLCVDEELRLAPGVWAAGDVARYPEAHVGEKVRIEHWRLAEQHGRAAAASMAGKGSPFTGVPFFWTQQFTRAFDYVGVGRGFDRLVVCGDIGTRDFTAFYAKGGRLVAACGTQSDEAGAFTELMRAGRLPAPDALEGRQKAGLHELL